MASDSEAENKAYKAFQQKALQLTECVRRFQLPKQFPSLHSESHLSKSNAEKKISVSPATGKVSLITNKALAGNLQKVNFKLPSNQELDLVKVLPVTQSVEIGQKFPSNRPRIKAITTYVDCSNPKRFSNLSSKISTDSNDLSSQKFQSILQKSFTTSNIHPAESKKHGLVGDHQNKNQRLIILNTNEETIREKDLKKLRDLKLLDGKKIIVMNNKTSKPIVKENLLKNYWFDKKLDINKLGQKRSSSDSNQNFPNKVSKKICFDNSTGNIDNVVISSDGDDEECENFQIKFKTAHAPKANMVIKKIWKDSNQTVKPKKIIGSQPAKSESSTLKNQDKITISEVCGEASFFLDEENIDNLQFINNISETDSENHFIVPLENNSSDLQLSKSSNNIQILQKAMQNVEDTELRKKALEALSDCGIKFKKIVPVKQPKSQKFINECGTQTEILSLLKNDELVKVDVEFESKVINQNNSSKKQMINSINTMTSDDDQSDFKKDLDKMLEKFDNKNIQEIERTLKKKPDRLAKIIWKQLIREFDRAKNFDENGFLGIHRAVLNDDLHEVQKNLIILKACKLSVDIESQDFKTSLELAVEYEVSSQIVKILLEAGAQPVSTKPRHDSALILAAKKSSKIFSLLLKYVNQSNRSLLNAKDVEGLAPIHYCAQNGNLEALVELINLRVDINLQDDKSGRYPLFYAVESRNHEVPQEIYNEIAHKLIENGAISNIPIFSKHTTLSMIDDVKNHTLKIALNRAVG